MNIKDHEVVPYLANVIQVTHADGKITTQEERFLEDLQKRIKAKKSQLNEAIKLVEGNNYKITKVGTFANQVSNLEDMLTACLVDGELAEKETQIISDFCYLIGVTQEQFDRMASQIASLTSQYANTVRCGSCSCEIAVDSKYCPRCGSQITNDNSSTTKIIEYEIPKSGYSLEFTESSAATFSSSLSLAQKAPSFQECERNKKKWYLATWPSVEFQKSISLADSLSSLRNKRIYIDGKEGNWKEIYNFLWCAEQRKTAYEPNAFCFGKDDNRLNPWGCKQLNMDWTGWARWLSYGEFKKTGITRKIVFEFDKQRITHELNTNLHKYRYCPHIRPKLIQAVLKVLPDNIEIKQGGDWEYHRIYEEVPGAIKIIEKREDGGFNFTEEYYADGVRPRGLNSLKSLLSNATSLLNEKSININQLLK